MAIETNGALSPDDAVAYAARILQDQLNVFVNFEEPRKEQITEAIPDLAFNPPSSRRSTSSNCPCARPLSQERQYRLHRRSVQKTEAEMLRTPNFRPQVAQTRSRRWPRWACISAWKCRAGAG